MLEAKNEANTIIERAKVEINREREKVEYQLKKEALEVNVAKAGGTPSGK